MSIWAVDPQNPGTLYGANNNALFKSSDGGVTWNAIGTGLPCRQCILWAVVIDPNNSSILYAGYDDTSDASGGVYKSTDGGATWSAAGGGLPAYQVADGRYGGVQALAIDPKNPNTLYAANARNVAFGGGVFKSTDGALSWNPVNSGLLGGIFNGAFITSLTVDPRNPGTIYASGMVGLFKSTDGGASWATVGTSGLRNLAVDPQKSDTLYAVSDGRGILKSTDGGTSWRAVLADATGWVAVTPAADGASTVYAGGSSLGVWKSLDGGSSWTLANSGLIGTSVDSLAIDPQDPQTLYAGVEGGVFKSADGAASWGAPTLMAPHVPGLAIYPPNPDIVYAAAGGSLQKSLDGGQSWVQLPVGVDDFDFTGLALDPENPGILYAGGFKSTDGGADWAKLSGFSVTAIALDPKNPATLYAGSTGGTYSEQAESMSSGVFKSTDRGQTWTGGNTLWQGVSVSAVMVDPSNSSVVYAQTAVFDCGWECNSSYYMDPNVINATGLYKSVDGGASWAKLALPSDPYTQLLAIDQQGTVYILALAPFGLKRSQDGGATWNLLPSTGLSGSISSLVIDPQDTNHLFVGTWYGGVIEIRLAE
jgi:photosystem II stability/assembly factor-like uncharacterized protein